MDLPPDKAKLLKNYDNEKKWDIICDQVSLECLFLAFFHPIPISVINNSFSVGFIQLDSEMKWWTWAELIKLEDTQTTRIMLINEAIERCRGPMPKSDFDGF